MKLAIRVCNGHNIGCTGRGLHSLFDLNLATKWTGCHDGLSSLRACVLLILEQNNNTNFLFVA